MSEQPNKAAMSPAKRSGLIWLTVILGFAFLVIIVASSMKEAPATNSPPPVVTNTVKQAKMTYDIPALAGKSIDQVIKILGIPMKNDEPTAAMKSAGVIEWDKTWKKDGETLLVTYDSKTRKVTDYFISTNDPSGVTSDKQYLLTVGNLKDPDGRYSVEYVQAYNRPSGTYTGAKVTFK